MTKGHRKIANDKTPMVSFVIVSWNRKKDLRFVLGEIRRQKHRNYEVVVVDNNSVDGSLEMLKTDFPGVRLIALDENIGVTAYNTGAAAAIGEYVVFLDDDSYPGRDAVADMIDVFESDSSIGVVSFDFRNHHAAAAHDDESAAKKKRVPSEAYAFSGGGAGIRRELFDMETGYPEEFFIYWNELDFAIRVMKRGYRIVHCAWIHAYHIASSVSRSGELAAYYHVRNLVWIYAKFFPIRDAVDHIRELLSDSVFFLAARAEPVYLKAWCDAVMELPRALKGRIKVSRDILEKIRISKTLAFVPVAPANTMDDANAAKTLRQSARCLVIRSSNLQHIAAVMKKLKKTSGKTEYHILTHGFAKESVLRMRNVGRAVEYPDSGDFQARFAKDIRWPNRSSKYDAVVVPFAAPDAYGYENVVEFALSLNADNVILCDSECALTSLNHEEAKKWLDETRSFRKNIDDNTMKLTSIITEAFRAISAASK